ncbi:MAG: endonuclease III domain-containing protein [Armatimonadota bacterium]
MPKQLRPRTFRRVDELLEEYYGPVKSRSEGPLNNLIRTILSQNTTDTNSFPAFERLRDHFDGDWEQALEAGPDAYVPLIESAGLAPTKSKRIHAILEQLKQQRGELSLEHVCDMEPDEAEEYLLGFKGVGPKTAAIVLLFECDMPFFPVDTHIHRVTGRLGWIPEGASAKRAYEILTDAIPAELHYQLHLNLVKHGRETCHPSRPRCHDCPISRFCDAYKDGKVAPREER